MIKDNEYHENAAESERMARLTRDKTDKRTWLNMAQHWRGLISVPPGGARSQRIKRWSTGPLSAPNPGFSTGVQ